MIKHTPGPWNTSPYVANDCTMANAELIALAPTAPHECDDPKCPGNINRKRLELYHDFVEACLTCNNMEDGYGLIAGFMDKAEEIEHKKAIEKGE